MNRDAREREGEQQSRESSFYIWPGILSNTEVLSILYNDK